LRKNSLVITTFYGLKDDNLLSDDLVLFLNNEKFKTYVILLDWELKFKTGIYRKNQTIIFCYSSRLLSKSLFFKWALMSPFAFFYFFKYLKKIKFDIFSSFSPVITVWFFVLFQRKVEKKALFYFDFFPIHHFQINKIKSAILQKVLYFIEASLVKYFDFVGCMSPKNIDYFVKYFSYEREKVYEVPLWYKNSRIQKNEVESTEFKKRLGVNPSDLLLLFGGQLEKGRGIEFLCELAKEITLKNIPATIIVLGKGSLESLILNASNKFDKIKYLGSVSKSEYKKFLELVDIGLAITVGGVDVPTYPSKVIEYSAASLPILANIESTSDISDILHKYDAGFVSNSGDMNMFLFDLSKLLDRNILKKMSLNSYNLFLSRHNIPTALNLFKSYINE
jgi:glycosyltransferase involved in cell wall biosynthesis